MGWFVLFIYLFVFLVVQLEIEQQSQILIHSDSKKGQ